MKQYNKIPALLATMLVSAGAYATGTNTVTGDYNTVLGSENVITANHATAIGFQNKATANETTVIGERATASGLNASAFGSATTATGESALAVGAGANATADSAVAIGNDSNATGKSSVSVGQSTNATAAFASAFGDSASALASGSVAISVDSKAKGVNSVAIGRDSNATHDNSVAIGAGSVSKEEVPVNEMKVGHTTYIGFAGNNPVATFSVGDKNKERQIVNVAAGEVSSTSTDAVNGSQLYTVAQAVENLVENQVVLCLTMYSSDNNVNIVQDDEQTFDFTLNKDITNLNSITTSTDNGDTTTVTTDGVNITHYDSPNGMEYHTSYNHNGLTIKRNDGDANPVDEISLTTDGLNNGGKRIINVKEGSNGTDAVNVNQLNKVREENQRITGQVTRNAENIAQLDKGVAQNTKAISKLDRDMRKNRKRADAGTAAVAAMANIPQVYLPGKSGVGVGVGHKHGQTALAIGYSQSSDNAHNIIKLSAGIDSQKDVTVGAGYMYQW